ncbi:MAG: ankyrin repeat domain-containing protein [Alphaproteobacteria bacterium]
MEITDDIMLDFMMASWGGNAERLSDFITRNPEAIHWRDEDGRTALIKSIAHGTGHIDVMEMLLSRGADINAADDAGMTPLMFAALHNKSDCLALLISKGADADMKDTRGLTAIGYARKLGHTGIVEALENAADLKRTAAEAARQLELAAVQAPAHDGVDHRVNVRKPIQYKP